jgi:D-aminopeptidase
MANIQTSPRSECPNPLNNYEYMKTSNGKKRFRDYGLSVGYLPTGTRNSIADVKGVRVGHTTRIEGDDIRTGVTVIDPGVPNLFMEKIPAALAVGNGYGKFAGATQLWELGTLETPIALTNTLAVGPAMRGIVDIVLSETAGIGPADSINAVVGETNDGLLNDIHRNTITSGDVRRAYDTRSENVAEGSIGAGTGTRLFSWKGGIGTSSRIVIVEGTPYAIGVLVQTNFGGSLTINGVPVGRLLKKSDFAIPAANDGSCMIVLATDAPLTSRQLERIAKRTFLGLARTGSVLASSSGDYAVAFSVSRQGVEGSGIPGSCLADSRLTEFFLAAAESVEESVYNALVAAETVQGRGGHVLEAFPIGSVLPLLSAGPDHPKTG